MDRAMIGADLRYQQRNAFCQLFRDVLCIFGAYKAISIFSLIVIIYIATVTGWLSMHGCHTCQPSRVSRDCPGNSSFVPVSRFSSKCPGKFTINSNAQWNPWEPLLTLARTTYARTHSRSG